ncbi:tetratricopeptide repeat protein [Akkermansiaceae bacterium]|nr:tetratricopeptide repeat protein [Akkermansiaceae bacterium]
MIFSSILVGSIGGIVMICGGVLSAAFYHYNESRELFENEAIGNHHQVDARIRAAALAFDSEMAENIGVKAHEFSLRSFEEGDALTAKYFQMQALEAFRIARRLNTHSIIALCSTARTLDEMGKYEEAYPLHLEAVKAAKFREFFLKPCVYAARNRINLALVAFEEGRLESAKTLFKEAQEFLEIRKKIIGSHDPGEDGSRFYASLKAWLTYFEAQRLYKSGDSLWKKRKAAKGMALMLEAEKRYQAAKKYVEPHDPLWAVQVKQLKQNLDILKGAAITPEEISPEEIERISKGLKSLDTPMEKR